MGYSTAALISKVQGGIASGDVTVTFKAENRPEDNPIFVRRFASSDRELEIIERYLGGPISHPKTRGKILVDRTGGAWKIDYAQMAADT